MRNRLLLLNKEFLVDLFKLLKKYDMRISRKAFYEGLSLDFNSLKRNNKRDIISLNVSSSTLDDVYQFTDSEVSK